MYMFVLSISTYECIDFNTVLNCYLFKKLTAFMQEVQLSLCRITKNICSLIKLECTLIEISNLNIFKSKFHSILFLVLVILPFRLYSQL